MLNGYANEIPAHYDIICISGKSIKGWMRVASAKM